MNERTTVRLPVELLNRARRKAAEEGKTLTSLIEDGLRIVTAEKRKDRQAKPLPLRVSKATGGLMPGIDISDSAALQDMEDLEYMERMKNFE